MNLETFMETGRKYSEWKIVSESTITNLAIYIRQILQLQNL
jgi:hypothetical protein